MDTIFSEKHRLRNAKTELYGGQLVEPFERPSRAEYIIDRVRSVGLGAVHEPTDYGMAPILAVHDADFVDFLQVAWRDWAAEGFEGEAITTVWPYSAVAFCRNASNVAPVSVSRAPVGSSAKIMSGRLASARAAAARCC